MKTPSREEVLEYLKNQAFAQFVGFYVGITSTGLVSSFFETRSISNLWGILAKRPLVDPQTFSILERVVAVVIGFVVFEIVSRNMKPLVERWKPIVTGEIARRRKEQDWDARARVAVSWVEAKRIVICTSLRKAFRDVFIDRLRK